MHVEKHVPKTSSIKLLDVGCNVGAWLSKCRLLNPQATLFGVELNEDALRMARVREPELLFSKAIAEQLPFETDFFDCLTCLEVLEHLPEKNWQRAVREMQRVLKPGGVLIITVPHAGAFAWMDSNNLRFRFPGVYRKILGRGLRDSNYDTLRRKVEWHKHFNVNELKGIIGSDGWKSVDFEFGGLFLLPVVDLLSWPFYRIGQSDHFVRKMLGKMGTLDYRLNFGPFSYGVCAICRKA